MASALRQPLLRVFCQAVRSSSKVSSGNFPSAVVGSQNSTRGLTLTRSLWCAVSGNGGSNKLNTKMHSKMCGCCSMQTEVDKKLATFLDSEIKGESKERTKQDLIDKIEGWETKTDGTRVTLTRKFNNEVISVEFDVNDSVDMNDDMGDSETGQNLVSRPPFEVVINKPSGKMIRFFCEFGMFNEDEEQLDDLYSIISVRLEDKSTSDVEKLYVHNATVMDENLYELLMDMLDERGVDDDFVENMIGYATAYESKKYISFLEELKSVLNEK